MAVTRDGTTSKLRQPDIIEAIRDVQRTAGNRAFRPAVMEMLLARFQLVPTKGQLNGMLWREGVSVGNDGVLRETDGAAALDLARKRSREEVDRRRQQREEARAAAVAASRPPEMVKPPAQPKQPRPAAVQQKPVVVQPPAPVTVISPPAAPAPMPPPPVPVVAVAPPLPDPPASPEVAPRPPPRQASCVFPLGDPGTREFQYCNDAIFPGRPYCLAHCTASYQGFKPERKSNEATASYAGLFPERRL